MQDDCRWKLNSHHSIALSVLDDVDDMLVEECFQLRASCKLKSSGRHRLGFQHPDGSHARFTSPLPQELLAAWDALK